MTDVFLSHATEDRETARAVADHLRQSGIAVWVARDTSVLQETANDAFQEADIIIMLVTPSHAKSSKLFFELGAALAMEKHVVPVVDKELKRLPLPLAHRNYLIRGSPAETVELIAAEVHDLLNKKAPEVSVSKSGVHPDDG